MEVNWGKANVWIYQDDPKDRMTPGIYYGWSKSPKKYYQHIVCGRYFTRKQKHKNCKEYSGHQKPHPYSKNQTLKMTYAKAFGFIYQTLYKNNISKMAVSDAAQLILKALGFKRI